MTMTQFDDRERAFESMYARDQEMQFKIVARRNRLLGQWAAKKMGLTEAEADAYAKDVIRSDFEEAGDHDVVRKVLGDLTAAGSTSTRPRSARRSNIRRSRRAARFIEAQGPN
jgi:hypothetical protein